MITAETLRQCAYLNSTTLEDLLRKNYPKDMVVQSEFVGITNGGQFAYKIAYPDSDSKNGLAVGKVFVWQDSNGSLVADY
jgi:hypothetical protein